MHFMNRVVNPLLPIAGEAYVGGDWAETTPTEQDVTDFFNLEREPNEKASMFFNKNYKSRNVRNTAPSMGEAYDKCEFKTRVLVMIFDTDEYAEELINIAQTGRDTALRESLRIGLITDKKLIRKLKMKHGNAWFQSDV
jgi:hypothetical protein